MSNNITNYDELLGRLAPREEQVIRLRYGLEIADAPPARGKASHRGATLGKHGRTLEEIAPILKVTRGRIHQIESKALRKLRHPTRAEPFKTLLREQKPPVPQGIPALAEAVFGFKAVAELLTQTTPAPQAVRAKAANKIHLVAKHHN